MQAQAGLLHADAIGEFECSPMRGCRLERVAGGKVALTHSSAV